MNERTHLRAGPFILAVAVAMAVVLSAPVVGQIRGWIRSAFPGRFVLIVGVIGAVMLAAALAAAAFRIRERRAWRYGAIGSAISIAVIYSVLNPSDTPESIAVERFHFLEYGLITFLFYRAWRPLGDLSIVLLPMPAGLIVGTAEEWLQWFIPNRVGELRDVFLNLAAIVSGLLFSVAVDPPDRFAPTLGRGSAARVLRLAAATVIVLAGFLHAVHLGHEINDHDIGSFMSRYAPDQLAALQGEKARTWRTNPPPLILKRISREDQYLSEGLAHVRERNKQWGAGNVGAAWNENRILEKYFVPVLDTPTYEGKQGHRWPPEQRADAEARAAAAPPAAPYVSVAYPNRLFTWPKGVFWAAVLALAAVLAGLGASRVTR